MDESTRRRRHRATYDVESSDLSSAQIATFRGICDGLHAGTLVYLRRRRLRGYSLRVVLTHDLAASVNDRWASLCPDAPEYTTVRAAGTAVGKMFRPRTAAEPFTVMLDDRQWLTQEEGVPPNVVANIAHEMAHCMIDVCRGDPSTPTTTNSLECGEFHARWIVREALDEYRADIISNSLLMSVTQATGGEAVTLVQLYEAFGLDPGDRLSQTLSDVVHPGWPDRIQAYRDEQVALEDMWEGLVQSSWEVLVAIAHAAALAWLAKEPDPICSSYAEEPGVSLYLLKPWCCMLDMLSETAPLPTPRRLARMDGRARSEGVESLLDMWAMLGITFEPLSGGGTFIHVAAPKRG